MTSRKMLVLLFSLGVTAPALLPSDADAAAILLTPTHDQRGIFNFGLDTEFHLQIDGGQDTVTFSPGPMPGTGFEERFAMEFDLSLVPAGAAITSTTLTLHLPVLPGMVQSSDIHGYAGNGTVEGEDLSVENFLTTFQPNALTVNIPIDPGFLQGLLLADEDFAGFALRNVTVPSGVFTLWTVDGPAATDPTLEIEYAVVPEPSTLLLVGTALAACGRRAFKRAVGKAMSAS